MKMHMIKARDLPDLWFQAVHDILDHGCRFNQASQVDTHVIDDKDGRARSNDQVLTEVAVEMIVRLVWQKTVDLKIVA